jgi:hypothetical protein
VPPVSIGNYGYALVWDEHREALVYVRTKEYGGEIEVWSDSGSGWELAKGKPVSQEGDERHGYYDPTRKAVLVWSTHFDMESKRHLPDALVVDASGAKPLATAGDAPLIEPEDEDVSTDIGCALTFDRAREVAVCFTRRGVWELDANGAWKKAADAKGVYVENWHNDAGAVFDPVRKRTVFWFQEGEDYEYLFVAWDGAKLSKVPSKGLPDLCTGLFDPCAMFTSHPEHGVVCWVGGDRGMFAFDGNAWKALPETQNPPPLMHGRFANGRPHIAHISGDRFVVGPGFHEGDEGGGEAQQVFYVLADRAWEKQGAVARPSELVELDSNRRLHAFSGASWHATSASSLGTMTWSESGWKKLASGESPGGPLADVAGTPEGLVAVTRKGAVARLEGEKWKTLSKPSADFGERTSFVLAFDAAQGRLVAWGGDVKGRKSNDTFFFDGKKWARVKAPSPVPRDHDKKKVEFVDQVALFDTALGRVVRFGFFEVAVLDGDVWTPHAPKGYTDLGGTHDWNHFPCHDPKTGETLLVNFDEGRVTRFDLGQCVEVAKLEYPAELAEKTEREHESIAHLFAHDAVFDPVSRTLESQHADDKWGRYSLDLGPVFDAAAKLGPRKLPAAQPASKTATKSAKAPSKGAALSREELERLGTRRSCAFSVGKKLKSLGKKHAVSRFGGLPSGVPAAKWPRLKGKPMGFLFQLLVDPVLSKHAAIAVFCALDGSATEDEDRNAVLLLSEKDLGCEPAAAPAGVPVLEARAIDVDDPLPEIDEDAVRALSERDPAVGAAFDRYQQEEKVQESGLGNKLGGAPVFLQGGEVPKGAVFVAQLDVDSLSLRKEWSEAGLAGCVYVFTDKAEKKAFATWQYT